MINITDKLNKYLLKTIKITYSTFNPDYALDFVMKSQNAIKISDNGLFLMKEYNNISILKKGDTVG